MNVGPVDFCRNREDLDFGVDCDSRVAIVGPNGAGEVRCSLGTSHWPVV